MGKHHIMTKPRAPGGEIEMPPLPMEKKHSDLSSRPLIAVTTFKRGLRHTE
jgi:hypothetical protein